MMDTARFYVRMWAGTWWIKGWSWFAARAPHTLRYWLTIDAIAKVTTGQYSNTNVADLPAMEVLKRLELFGRPASATRVK
jgi:hypothetical protein